MSSARALKYLLTYSLPVVVAIAFLYQGFWSWFPMIYAFAIIPLMELMFPAKTENLTKVEEELIKNDPFYDWMIYLTVPVLYGCLGWFCWLMTGEMAIWERVGLVFAMGLMCGTFGINVGHELGHRKKKSERTLAKISLLSSQYMHFFIEHNRGHHHNVSTVEDPASARYGEMIFSFWIRSVVHSYLGAWQLERTRLSRLNKLFWSWENEMVRFSVIQLGFILAIGFGFSWAVIGWYLGAAVIGFLLLETVNYIEHYGLAREKNEAGVYEKVRPHHSWNSNHVIGRLLLFELSRHSDHHFIAGRKYQILRHHDNSPQMPTGYPGMMVMALIPPVWFGVMNKRAKKAKLAA